MIKIDFSDLLNLCDKLSHRIEEQDETINCLQHENNNLCKNIGYLCDENIRLRHELNEVKADANNKIY